ncbi:4-hydroxybenzoate 3-monooxygenase [Micromonospora olivasterospora]|uniref:4-hydroxybenzoate 3-monooxygenase n=1 Tax=Micromonospora olivasterospora TaxID=1880 RepID=A0A562IJ97_MICOL|nr:4-hydroxybenzoate 3-monooxygenase [Micromonospora olivasterospora]
MTQLAFLIAPMHGHVNPTLPVARELVARGHRVIYWLTAQFRDAVAATGAEFREIRTPPPDPRLPADTDPLVTLALIPARLAAAAVEVLPGVLDGVRELGPDTVVVYDQLCVWGRLVAEVAGVPAAMLCTTYASNEHFSFLTGPHGRTVPRIPAAMEVFDGDLGRLAAPILFDVDEVSVHDPGGDRPRVTFTDAGGTARTLVCDVVAGCDGFHGVSRTAFPPGALRTYRREYPFAWLGILARTPPSHHELIYAYSDRGFALHSMRSPEITRLYLQVPAGERIEDWPDDRIWDELAVRLAVDGFDLRSGPVLEKGLTSVRSVVTEPMRYGRLLLAGDAAHIVPPTGAKGMNLAVADALDLSRALVPFLSGRSTELLDGYSDRRLHRVWRAEHFSWWMTSMLHRFPDDDPFERRLQLAQLRYTVSSVAAATSLAENSTWACRTTSPEAGPRQGTTRRDSGAEPGRTVRSPRAPSGREASTATPGRARRTRRRSGSPEAARLRRERR